MIPNVTESVQVEMCTYLQIDVGTGLERAVDRVKSDIDVRQGM